jgi:hypothetical protein
MKSMLTNHQRPGARAQPAPQSGEAERPRLPKEYAFEKLTFDWGRLEKWELDTVRELWKAIGPVDRIYSEQKAPGTNEIVSFLEEVARFADRDLRGRMAPYIALVKLNHSIFDSTKGDRKLEADFGRDEILETIREKVPVALGHRLRKAFDSGICSELFDSPADSERPLSGGLYIGESGPADVPAGFFRGGEEGTKFREALIASFPEGEREEVRKGMNSHANVVVFKDGRPARFIPYAEYFRADTERIRDALINASKVCDDPNLKEYLLRRSEDLMTEDCSRSDIAWLKVRSRLNVVVGDIETYIDRACSTRRQCDMIIYYTDDEKMGKVREISAMTGELERKLPVTDEVKEPYRKTEPPVVANALHCAGGDYGPISTVAFSLPNDEDTVREHGSRSTMLYNAIVGKVRPRTIRISELMLDRKTLSQLSIDDIVYGDFIFVLLHENSHPLGKIRPSLAARGLDTRKALGTAYNTLEEAKADVVGLYHVPYLVEKGVLSEKQRDGTYASVLLGYFTALRTGLGARAHTDADAMEFNYLREKGGITLDSEGKYGIDLGKFEAGIAGLCERLLAIEADGDAEGAKRLLEAYVRVTPEIEASLERLKDVPKVTVLEYPELPEQGTGGLKRI